MKILNNRYLAWESVLLNEMTGETVLEPGENLEGDPGIR
jgi:hypothetical protein